jgi:O-antigen ligase
METINDKKRLKNILLVMIISASLMVVDAGVQYFSGKDFLRGFSFERLRASFPSANDFAGWLIMFIPIFLGILATKQLNGLERRIKKIALGALVALMLICLVLTYSRGAWLGFIFGLALIDYEIIKLLGYRNKILVYPLMIVCLIGIFFILPLTIKERIKSIGDININLNRISLWKESLSIIEDFPVFGSGLNTYSVVGRNYKIMEEGGIYPHNSFLQMAAETGVIGLVSFVWILIVLFRSGFQTLSRKKDPLLLGILAGILAFLVQSFFDTNLYALQLVVLFWFMMGLAVAVMRLELDVSK